MASQEASHDKSITQKDQKATQKKSDPTFDTSSLEKTIRESIKEAREKRDAHTEEKLKGDRALVEHTRQLSSETQRLADFTFWLVIVTIVVALIAVGQLVMFWFQLGYIKTDVMHTHSQVKLARQEYLATHLPKLIIRRVGFVENPTRISYAITNVGESGAIVIESNVTVHIFEKGSSLPFRPPYDNEMNSLGHLRVAVRETVVRECNSPELTDRVEIIDRQNRYHVMFLGWILYRNIGGHRRYTAFCRIYDPVIQGFRKRPEPDVTIPEYDRYEYID